MSDARGTEPDEADGEEGSDDGVLAASDLGGEGPPIEEKPYKIVFEANKCFGAGKCAEVADNWEMDVVSGMAKPRTYYIGEDDLAENVRAAEACPAKKERGVIHVVDRRTDEEIAPDPHGDGTLSVDW
ncbi:ferredoxin [Halorubrum halodurans]|uniref:Ferredoxin n=1 Tax=Halorubrum halodurans TaxID=1383851 RepID=A0A256IB21_9EURY|nr:ferredoxin [Halorubrum halodurans]OYR53755.1 ferredoxin [Halorubrum halodurans]